MGPGRDARDSSTTAAAAGAAGRSHVSGDRGGAARRAHRGTRASSTAGPSPLREAIAEAVRARKMLQGGEGGGLATHTEERGASERVEKSGDTGSASAVRSSDEGRHVMGGETTAASRRTRQGSEKTTSPPAASRTSPPRPPPRLAGGGGAVRGRNEVSKEEVAGEVGEIAKMLQSALGMLEESKKEQEGLRGQVEALSRKVMVYEALQPRSHSPSRKDVFSGSGRRLSWEDEHSPSSPKYNLPVEANEGGGGGGHVERKESGQQGPQPSKIHAWRNASKGSWRNAGVAFWNGIAPTESFDNSPLMSPLESPVHAEVQGEKGAFPQSLWGDEDVSERSDVGGVDGAGVGGGPMIPRGKFSLRLPPPQLDSDARARGDDDEEAKDSAGLDFGAMEISHLELNRAKLAQCMQEAGSARREAESARREAESVLSGASATLEELSLELLSVRKSHESDVARLLGDAASARAELSVCEGELADEVGKREALSADLASCRQQLKEARSELKTASSEVLSLRMREAEGRELDVGARGEGSGGEEEVELTVSRWELEGADEEIKELRVMLKEARVIAKKKEEEVALVRSEMGVLRRQVRDVGMSHPWGKEWEEADRLRDELEAAGAGLKAVIQADKASWRAMGVEAGVTEAARMRRIAQVAVLRGGGFDIEDYEEEVFGPDGAMGQGVEARLESEKSASMQRLAEERDALLKSLGELRAEKDAVSFGHDLEGGAGVESEGEVVAIRESLERSIAELTEAYSVLSNGDNSKCERMAGKVDDVDQQTGVVVSLSEMDAIEAERQAAASLLGERDSELRGMEAEIAGLREEIQESLSTVEERDDALRSVNEQVARLEAEKSSLGDMIRLAQAEVEANVEQIRVITCRCDAAEGALREARKQIVRLEQERGEGEEMLMRLKSDKGNELMRLENEKEEVITRLEKELSIVRVENEEVIRLENDKEEAIMRLEKELSIVRVEKEVLERRGKEDGEELTRARNEVEEVRRQMKTTTEKLRMECTRLVGEVDALQKTAVVGVGEAGAGDVATSIDVDELERLLEGMKSERDEAAAALGWRNALVDSLGVELAEAKDERNKAMVLLLECRGERDELSAERDALSSERDALLEKVKEELTTADASGVTSSPRPPDGAKPSSEGTLISFTDDDDLL